MFNKPHKNLTLNQLLACFKKYRVALQAGNF
jgi:hypothetical protein